MQMFLDIVRQSLSTLWAHKLRSFLTMFGIAWGVGSLLLLVGLGEGFRSGQKKNLAELGSDILFVFPGKNSCGRRQPAIGDGNGTSLIGDYLAVRAEAKHLRTIFSGAEPRGHSGRSVTTAPPMGRSFGVAPRI